MIANVLIMPLQSMAKSEDRLEMLKARYLKQIEEKQAEIAAVKQRLLLLDELKAEADNLLLIDSPMAPDPRLDPLPGHLGTGSGLTDAIINAAASFKGKPFSPPEMRKFLLATGFKPSGKHFGVSVGTTLKRLAMQKRMLCETLKGRPVYRLNPSPDP
jgi:hypothetical protein